MDWDWEGSGDTQTAATCAQMEGSNRVHVEREERGGGTAGVESSRVESTSLAEEEEDLNSSMSASGHQINYAALPARVSSRAQIGRMLAATSSRGHNGDVATTRFRHTEVVRQRWSGWRHTALPAKHRCSRVKKEEEEEGRVRKETYRREHTARPINQPKLSGPPAPRKDTLP